MMHSLRLLVLAALTSAVMPVYAGTAVESFVAGVEALQNDDTAKAIDALETSAAAAPSALAYANLASAYRRAGDDAGAAWAAASALSLGGVGGRTGDLERSFVHLPPELVPLPPPPTRQVWRRWASVLTGGVWQLAGLALWLTGFALVSLRVFGAGNARTRTLSYAGLLSIAFGAVAIGFAHTHARMLRASVGVTTDSADLHAAPSARSDAQRVLPKGAVLELGEGLDDHYAVKLPNGERGWVAQDRLRRVLAAP